MIPFILLSFTMFGTQVYKFFTDLETFKSCMFVLFWVLVAIGILYIGSKLGDEEYYEELRRRNKR